MTTFLLPYEYRLYKPGGDITGRAWTPFEPAPDQSLADFMHKIAAWAVPHQTELRFALRNATVKDKRFKRGRVLDINIWDAANGPGCPVAPGCELRDSDTGSVLAEAAGPILAKIVTDAVRSYEAGTKASMSP